MFLPPPLRPGSRVAVVAPAFPAERAVLESSLPIFHSLGLTPFFFPSCFARHGWFSGPDHLRASDIQEAFADDSFSAVFCLRGGYGSARLLPLLDFDQLSAHPKWFLGYSDATAIHLLLQGRCALITLHGPMVFEFSKLGREALRSLRASLFSRPSLPQEQNLQCISPGRSPHAEGILLGGNLTVLASLAGTPWQPALEGCLLFLEDVGEPLYRIDRMLTSLIQSGMLRGCSGILLGSFYNCRPDERHPAWNFTIAQLVRELFAPLGIPVLAGLPAGHHPGALTIPLGVRCRIHTHSGRLTLA